MRTWILKFDKILFNFCLICFSVLKKMKINPLTTLRWIHRLGALPPPPHLWVFPVLSEVSFLYSIHTTIASQISFSSHKQSVSHTQTVTYINLLTWLHIHITAVHTCNTHTDTHKLYVSPRLAEALVDTWCSISRTTHYYSNTLLFKSCNVLSIWLNQLYWPPEAKQFTNTLLLWRNDMNFEWTHYMVIFLFSYNVFLRALPIFWDFFMLFLLYETVQTE